MLFSVFEDPVFGCCSTLLNQAVVFFQLDFWWQRCVNFWHVAKVETFFLWIMKGYCVWKKADIDTIPTQ
jgi:hypothetical protein